MTSTPSGGSPEAAGGDFGAEARALGTMTARMHLALDRAFLRHHEPVVDWVDAAEAAIAAADPALLEAPGVADLLKWLREADARLPVIRTHGDFHLGRTARTDQGWVVSDCAPGGVLAGGSSPGRRTPLADVADLLWSMHQASTGGRGGAGPGGPARALAPLGQAWETQEPPGLRDRLPGHPGHRRAWSGPTATWCAAWCRSSSWPARCGQALGTRQSGEARRP